MHAIRLWRYIATGPRKGGPEDEEMSSETRGSLDAGMHDDQWPCGGQRGRPLHQLVGVWQEQGAWHVRVRAGDEPNLYPAVVLCSPSGG